MTANVNKKRNASVESTKYKYYFSSLINIHGTFQQKILIFLFAAIFVYLAETEKTFIELDYSRYFDIIEVTVLYHLNNLFEVSVGIIEFFLERFLENPLPWIFLGIWSFIVTLILMNYAMTGKKAYLFVGFSGCIIGSFMLVFLVMIQPV